MGLLDQVLGSVLGNRMGQGGQSGRASPLVTALIALLASRAMAGQGGLGGLLGGMGTGPAGGAAQGGGPLGGGPLGGGMGTPGGGLGGLLGGGLGELLQRFQQNGYGDVINSWIGHGQNRPITPAQLTDALGPDAINQLSHQTGMPQEQLTDELSQVLPDVIDKLTPEGRLPNDSEMARWA